MFFCYPASILKHSIPCYNFSHYDETKIIPNPLNWYAHKSFYLHVNIGNLDLCRHTHAPMCTYSIHTTRQVSKYIPCVSTLHWGSIANGTIQYPIIDDIKPVPRGR